MSAPGFPPQGPEAPGEARRRRPLVATLIPLVALAGLLGWVAWNGFKTDTGSSRGPAPGSRMPPFAAPVAASALEGDVNVAREAGEGAAGKRPACDVRGPDVLNSCDLVRGAPAAIAFIGAGNARCADAFDELSRLARGSGVRVAAVIVRGDREQARALVGRRGWRAPVAWDRDGVLANLYGVAVCPQVVYLEEGGRVEQVSIGDVPPAEVRDDLRRLSEGGR